MTIALRNVVSNPGDASTLYDAGPGNQSIDPTLLGAVTGDLIYFRVMRRSLNAIVMAQTGGQSWTAGTLRQGGSSSVQIFWCRFNGTWSNNPSIVTVANSAILISLFLSAYTPTSGTNTWALDVPETYHTYNAPVTPFDVTAAGQTAIANSVVAIFDFHSLDNNTWSLQTAISNAGLTQYRNVDPGAGRDMSGSIGYKVQASSGATGNVTNRQATLGGDAGLWIVNVFKEQSSGVTVSGMSSVLIHNGTSGVTVSGASFGATKTGAADLIASPTNNIVGVGAVSIPTSAWSDTLVTMGVIDLSTFVSFTPIYLFVKNSAGQSNSSGFIFQRQAWMSLTETLKNLAGSTQTNVTAIDYRITTLTINGNNIISGADGAADGAGSMTLGPVVLTSGGALAVGDDVWVSIAKNGATQALSFSGSAKVTPTYT